MGYIETLEMLAKMRNGRENRYINEDQEVTELSIKIMRDSDHIYYPSDSTTLVKFPLYNDQTLSDAIIDSLEIMIMGYIETSIVFIPYKRLIAAVEFDLKSDTEPNIIETLKSLKLPYQVFFPLD